MGVVSKTSIKFSIILYIGIALGYVNTVLIFPNVLGDEVFGLTRILFTAAGLIAQLSQLGTGNILVRFHPYLKDDKKNTTLTLGLLLSFAGGLISAICLFVFKEQINAVYSEKAKLFTDYYYLLLPAVISLIAFNLFDAYLRVLIKNSFTAFLNSILLRLIWLAIVLLYAFEFYDTDTFINVYVGGQIFVSSLAFLYTLKQGRLNLGLQLSPEKIKTFKSMSRFGIVTILSGLSFFLINQVDILMVGSYIGLTDVAIYSIALYMSSVILVPAQSISRTTAVLMADAFKNDNHEMIHTLYKKTALNQMLFGSLIFMLIAINYDSLMSFLRETYADSFMVFFLLGLAKIIDTAFGINGAVLISSKYYKMDTFFSIILLIFSIILKLIMIPKFGIIGAAGSTAIALILFNLAKYSFLKVKLKISPFTKDYFLLFSLLVISFVVVFFIPQVVNIWVDMFVKSGLFCLITIPTVYLLKFSPEFNDIIDKALEMSKQVINR